MNFEHLLGIFNKKSKSTLSNNQRIKGCVQRHTALTELRIFLQYSKLILYVFGEQAWYKSSILAGS